MSRMNLSPDIESLVAAMDLKPSEAWGELRRELERMGVVDPRSVDASAGRQSSQKFGDTHQHPAGAYNVVPAFGTSRLHVLVEHGAMCALCLDRLLLAPRHPGLRIDRAYIGSDKQIGGTCVPIETLDIEPSSHERRPDELLFRALWLDHPIGPNVGQRPLMVGETIWVELTSVTAIDVPVYLVAPFRRAAP